MWWWRHRSVPKKSFIFRDTRLTIMNRMLKTVCQYLFSVLSNPWQKWYQFKRPYWHPQAGIGGNVPERLPEEKKLFEIPLERPEQTDIWGTLGSQPVRSVLICFQVFPDRECLSGTIPSISAHKNDQNESLWLVAPYICNFWIFLEVIYLNSHLPPRILCNFDCPLFSSLSPLLLFAFLDICEYSRTASSLNRSLSASIFSIGMRNLDMSYVFFMFYNYNSHYKWSFVSDGLSLSKLGCFFLVVIGPESAV